MSSSVRTSDPLDQEMCRISLCPGLVWILKIWQMMSEVVFEGCRPLSVWYYGIQCDSRSYLLSLGTFTSTGPHEVQLADVLCNAYWKHPRLRASSLAIHAAPISKSTVLRHTTHHARKWLLDATLTTTWGTTRTVAPPYVKVTRAP